ncbi:MAG: translation initiation factor IF-2 [Oscillospiraceae bacterium]|nr:translation initiation factor IF-2 [Oscillospiraceae bacterium]
MARIRVYELAKEMEISSKDLINFIKAENLDVNVKNHMSVIEGEYLDIIKEFYAGNSGSNNLNGKSKEIKKEEVAEVAVVDNDQIRILNEKQKIEDKYENLVEKNNNYKKGKKFRKNKFEEAVNTNLNTDPIDIGSTISIKDLSSKINKPVNEVIKTLIFLGVIAAINQEIDFDTAKKLCSKFGIEITCKECKIVKEVEEEKEDASKLIKRPPVITVMGHVDHGKTSLLDAIRKSKVVEGEAGGITQHIGAYTVEINGEKITFLDTPGHEAFTAMRARGAKITDIVILVVAADDGIMPQTIEAINHSRAANVPIIVAINKIDKPGANIDRVKQELADYDLLAEDWGGKTICSLVSAKAKIGIDELLEMVLLVAEMEELKANPNREAHGAVIEANLDKGRGPVATLLVESGTLKVGDSIVVGDTYGRIRAMFDDKMKSIKSAGPSIPAEVIGLSEVPEAGDRFSCVKDEKTAREIAESSKLNKKDSGAKRTRVSLEDLYSQIKEGKIKELDIIVKADVQGSAEAIHSSLEKLSTDEVKVRVIHSGVGAITESDVTLAYVSDAIIIGFNVRPNVNAQNLASKDMVHIQTYRVIYDAIEDVKKAMIGMLEPEKKEVIVGSCEVRKIYKLSNVGTIAGCYVLSGKISRNSQVRLIRDGIVVFESTLSSLKRFKDDVKEVNQNYECGLTIDKFNDVKEGDIIEAFAIEEIKKKEL